MVMIGIFAFTLDSGKAKSNWIEQITNAKCNSAVLTDDRNNFKSKIKARICEPLFVELFSL